MPRFSIPLFVVVLLGIALVGCDGAGGNDAVDDLADAPLRDLAGRAGLAIGAAVDARALADEPRYASVLSREFGLLTAENAMKFGPLRPSRTTFDFDEADALAAFAEARRMGMRGHTLVWHQQLPFWVTNPNAGWTRDALTDVLREHIRTVAGRYAGRVGAWDVVNEVVDDGGGGLRPTVWLDVIGEAYIPIAFQVARDVDPEAALFYNDYGIEDLDAKSEQAYRLVEQWVADGVPIDGIGFQMHVTADDPPDPRDVAANMRRYADLGLEVHVTEMDVRIRGPVDDAALARQAEVYAQLLGVCLDEPSCTAFVLWGFTDRYSWVPDTFPGQGSALIFDEAYEPKPAYDALRQTLLDAVRAAD